MPWNSFGSCGSLLFGLRFGSAYQPTPGNSSQNPPPQNPLQPTPRPRGFGRKGGGRLWLGWKRVGLRLGSWRFVFVAVSAVRGLRGSCPCSVPGGSVRSFPVMLPLQEYDNIPPRVPGLKEGLVQKGFRVAEDAKDACFRPDTLD